MTELRFELHGDYDALMQKLRRARELAALKSASETVLANLDQAIVELDNHIQRVRRPLH